MKEDNINELNMENSLSILKAENCLLISIDSNRYWDKNTIKQYCISKREHKKVLLKLQEELQQVLMKRYQDKPENRGMEPFINYLFVQRNIDEIFHKFIGEDNDT